MFISGPDRVIGFIVEKKGLIYNPDFLSQATEKLFFMDKTLFFSQIFDHAHSKKYPSQSEELSADIEKQLLTSQSFNIDRSTEWLIENSIRQGEIEILQQNLQKGLGFFYDALRLSSGSFDLWYKLALSLFSYGMDRDDEKILLFASKAFKEASEIDKNSFSLFSKWGSLLSLLGVKQGEFHYFQSAKEKFQQALVLSKGCSNAALFEIYWEYAVLWIHIGHHSGEAVDIRSALDNFEIALSYAPDAHAEFWLDYGQAYMEMGLLIGDDRHFFEAITHLERSLKLQPNSSASWAALAEVHTHLYIDTMHEKYFIQASNCFAQAVVLEPDSADLYLRWSQLLGEAGRLNKDPKKLELAVEKCVEAKSRDTDNLLILAQLIEVQSLLGAYTQRLDLLLEAESAIIEATDQFPDDPHLWYSYGICLLSFGIYYDEIEFYDLAIEKFQIGISLNRTSAEIWHALANCHAYIADVVGDSSLFERAIKFYKKAIDLKPKCPPLLFDYALALYKMGELATDLDTIELALVYFEKTIQCQKDALIEHPEWLFYYGCCLDLMGDLVGERSYYIRSSEILLHILLITPDYPEIYYRLALTFFHLAEMDSDRQLGEKSLNYFQLAVKQDDENGSIWLDWGLSLIHLAQLSVEDEVAKRLYKEAEQKLTKAGKLGNQYAYYHLSCFYSLQERYEESIFFLKKAHKLQVLPSLEELFLDDWLDGLRGTALFEEFVALLEKGERKF